MKWSQKLEINVAIESRNALPSNEDIYIEKLSEIMMDIMRNIENIKCDDLFKKVYTDYEETDDIDLDIKCKFGKLIETDN